MVGLGFIVYSPLLSNTYSTRVENKQLWKILNTTPPWSHLCSSSIILYQYSYCPSGLRGSFILPLLYVIPPHPSLHPSIPNQSPQRSTSFFGSLHVFNVLWSQPNMSFLCIVPQLIALKNPIIILDLHQLWAPIWASSLANRPHRPKPTSWVGLSTRPPSPPKLCGGFVSSCSLHHPSGVFQLSCSPSQNA